MDGYEIDECIFFCIKKGFRKMSSLESWIEGMSKYEAWIYENGIIRRIKIYIMDLENKIIIKNIISTMSREIETYLEFINFNYLNELEKSRYRNDK